MNFKVPAVDPIISADLIRQTGAAIAATQQPSGAIPWFTGGHTDVWDHVQAAMALSAVGLLDEAERAYLWLKAAQRSDGSWPIRYEGELVTDPNTDSNFCAYVAMGVWHHSLITADKAFLTGMWPTVKAAIKTTLRHQRTDGTVTWASSKESGFLPEALVTGNSSIHLSLRCAVAIAESVGDPHPEWELAATLIRHNLDHHPDRFTAKPTHSMDWYYPVLGGSLPEQVAEKHIDERWHEFVVPDLGARCVSTNPWVTGAETCELVLALDAIGRHDDARMLFQSMQHLRDTDGSYWTGLVYEDGKRWPVERTTWTAATVVLAADALSRTTPANGIFRGDYLPLCVWEGNSACPCPV